MKDREDYDRMLAEAFPMPPQGATGATSVRSVCGRCRSSLPLGEACGRCGTRSPSLPSFWWSALPIGASSVRVLQGSGSPLEGPTFDDLSSFVGDGGAGETLVAIGKIPRRARFARWRAHLTGRRPPPFVEVSQGSRSLRAYNVNLGEQWKVLVVAPRGAGESFLEVLSRRVATEVGAEEGELHLRGIELSDYRAATCFLGRGHRPDLVVKIPLTGRMQARCAENLRMLGELESRRDLPGRLRTLLPRAVGRVDVDGHPTFVETALHGSSSLPGPSSLRITWLRPSAASFLTRLHATTREDVVLDRSRFEDRVGHYCDRLVRTLATEEASFVTAFKEELRAKLEGKRWPMVLEHGDFHLKNCLFTVDGRRLTGVVDWDLSRLGGFAVLDLLHLVVTTEGPRQIDGETAGRLLSGELWAGSKKLVEDYLRAVGLGAEALRPFAMVYMISNLFGPFLVRLGERKDSWYRDVVQPSLRTLASCA